MRGDHIVLLDEKDLREDNVHSPIVSSGSELDENLCNRAGIGRKTHTEKITRMTTA